MVRKSVQRRLIETLQGQVDQEFSIELKVGAEEDEETYLLVGNQPQLKAQISQIMAFRQVIQNIQLDPVIGYPYEQFVWEHKAPLSVQIHWRLTKAPPFEPKDIIKRFNLNRASPPRPYATVPISRANCTWQKIKEVAGGLSGRTWGHHYAIARMLIPGNEGNIKAPTIKVHADSEENAIRDLKRLLTLNEDVVYTVTTGKEVQTEGVRKSDSGMKKPSIKVYPAWFWIANWELVDNARRKPTEGRSTKLGKEKRSRHKIWLYPSAEPTTAANDIAEMIKRAR